MEEVVAKIVLQEVGEEVHSQLVVEEEVHFLLMVVNSFLEVKAMEEFERKKEEVEESFQTMAGEEVYL